ncbi:hypothetical protein C8J56DRAFT_422352 [Mycena floridula]|nr:hypothetical protein C8J56DRAFT_422352 [Mycena floridula]
MVQAAAWMSTGNLLPVSASVSLLNNVPPYSAEPISGEIRLDYRPPPDNVDNRDGIFIHKKNNVTIVLNNQPKSTSRASYERSGAKVTGSLLFDRPKAITSVSIKLCGVIECSFDYDVPLCDDFHSLYEGDLNDSMQEALPFSFFFPSTFEYQGKTYLLPPSYLSEFPDSVSVRSIRCIYRLVITVSAARRLLGKSTDSFSIEVEYYPRSRPSRPILHNPSFFSSIKDCPEEWHQTLFEVPIPSLEPISCQLYLPSVGVFYLHDSIPFHLQLTASLPSLRLLTPIPNQSKPSIRVYLLRRVVVTSNGQTIRRNLILGEATLNALPPALSLDENLNWEGKVRCTNFDVRVGGFDAGFLVVQDLVTCEVLYHTEGSPPISHRHGVSIKLVTDSWGTDAGRAIPS